VPKFSRNFEEILSRPHGNFEGQNKVLEFSTIIIIIIIIIILVPIIISALCNCYISNKVLLEERKRGSNWATAISYYKR
jgi:hypothetical protein